MKYQSSMKLKEIGIRGPQSIAPSTLTNTPAHGVPLPPSASSYRAFPLGPRLWCAMSKKPTGQSQSVSVSHPQRRCPAGTKSLAAFTHCCILPNLLAVTLRLGTFNLLASSCTSYLSYQSIYVLAPYSTHRRPQHLI